MEETERMRKIKEAGERIAQAADVLKETADQLRADVDALARRVSAVESDTIRAADNLVVSSEKVAGEQIIQDGRLDTLEN